MFTLNIEKIRICKAQKALELIEKFEERIEVMQKNIYSENHIFPPSKRYLKDYVFAKISLERLEKYYTNLFQKQLN